MFGPFAIQIFCLHHRAIFLLPPLSLSVTSEAFGFSADDVDMLALLLHPHVRDSCVAVSVGGTSQQSAVEPLNGVAVAAWLRILSTSLSTQNKNGSQLSPRTVAIADAP